MLCICRLCICGQSIKTLAVQSFGQSSVSMQSIEAPYRIIKALGILHTSNSETCLKTSSLASITGSFQSELATIKSNRIEVLDLIWLLFWSARFDLIDLLRNRRPDLFDLICFWFGSAYTKILARWTSIWCLLGVPNCAYMAFPITPLPNIIVSINIRFNVIVGDYYYYIRFARTLTPAPVLPLFPFTKLLLNQQINKSNPGPII